MFGLNEEGIMRSNDHINNTIPHMRELRGARALYASTGRKTQRSNHNKQHPNTYARWGAWFVINSSTRLYKHQGKNARNKDIGEEWSGAVQLQGAREGNYKKQPTYVR